MEAKVGVSAAQVICFSAIKSEMLLRRVTSSGTQTHPPRVRVVRISMSETSKVYDANWRARDEAERWSAGPWEAALLLKAAWETIVPLF